VNKDSAIYIAGHRGMVGSAIARQLLKEGYKNLILRTSSELDLRNQQAVNDFFAQHKPEYVFLAAAKVGGILANDSYPADFLRDNLQIQTNVIDAAWRNGVTKLAFLGSSCIYPKLAPQPMAENCLLTGLLEPTNECYAIAKIAGIKMCEAYHKQYGFNAVSLMPTNLYGPNDHYDLQTSHVLPAMIRKFHLARLAQDGNIAAIAANESRYGTIPEDILRGLGIERVNDNGDISSTQVNHHFRIVHSSPKVTLWGSGEPYREFLHVDDMVDACLFIMDLPEKVEEGDDNLYNLGVGNDIRIKDLANMVRLISGFEGSLIWDDSKPDGTPRKLMDVSKINTLGWQAKTDLADGIQAVYQQYLLA